MDRGSLPLIYFFIITLVFAYFFIYGLIGWNALLSFSRSLGLKIAFEISGFEQYLKMIHDPVFWVSIRNNLILISVFIPACIALGLFLAILLDITGGRGEAFFGRLYLLPFSLSFVVTASMWAWMYNYVYGVINTILSVLNLNIRVNWLGNPDIALYSVVIVLLWQFSGYACLVILAGIKSIPESQFHAARIDGASTFQVYSRIVLPQIKFWIFSIFVVLMVFALKAFDLIYVLTNGGPGVSTYVLALLMYRRGFFETDFQYGAALANILYVLVMAIVVPYLLITLRKR
jgi:glucose/mannose transport system permease protein